MREVSSSSINRIQLFNTFLIKNKVKVTTELEFEKLVQLRVCVQNDMEAYIKHKIYLFSLLV